MLCHVAQAKTPVYTDAVKGPFAKITFQNESEMDAQIYLYKDGALCKQKRRIQFDNKAGSTVIKFNASKKIAFEYGLYAGKVGHCVYTISFTPTPNDHYLISARTTEEKTRHTQCHLQLIRMHPEGIYSRVDFEIRTPKAAYSDDEAHCEPVSKEQKRVFTDE